MFAGGLIVVVTGSVLARRIAHGEGLTEHGSGMRAEKVCGDNGDG